MANVSSKNVELKVIALFFVAPVHIQAMTIDISLFAYDKHKIVVKLIKEYVKKYKVVPTIEALKNYANMFVEDAESLEKLAEALVILEELPEVVKEEAVYYFDKLQEYKLGRDLYDVGALINTEFSKPEVEFSKFRNILVKRLLNMKKNDEGIIRGGVFSRENVIKNLQEYKDASKGEDTSLIRYGIASVDAETGGMKKTFLALVYAAPGVGKSTFGINIAYNAMLANHKVVYMSLEMAHSNLSKKLFSRACLLDSKDIIYGKLPSEKYIDLKTGLINHIKLEKDLYIVDINEICTCTTIRSEIEKYISSQGIPPDLVIIDHAGLMSLDKDHRVYDRPTLYDILFKELHVIAKFYNCAIFTMIHESRTATLRALESYKKSKEDPMVDGMHNIGTSNSIANHCEHIFHLRQSEIEKRANKITLVLDKTRFSGGSKRFMLNCYLDLTYIGDARING